MTLTLADLIRSSNAIMSSGWTRYNKILPNRHYPGRATHSKEEAMKKPFGTIMYNNKTVIYDEASGILEIRMLMGVKTEKAYKGVHAVRMALLGVKGKVYNNLEELYMDKIGNGLNDTLAMSDNSIISDKSANKPFNDFKRMVDKRERNYHKNTANNRAFPDEGSDLLKMRYFHELNVNLTGAIIPVTNTDAKTQGGTYEATEKIFYLEDKIDVNCPCRVSCSCSDYYYRVGWYNYENEAHLGAKPTPYPNKDGKSETKQNILKVPGLCKHLMMFAVLLVNGGIINNLGSDDFKQFKEDMLRNRKMNRAENFKIPRKLTDEVTLQRMYQKLNKELIATRKARNIRAGYKATDIQGYDRFKNAIMRKHVEDIKAGIWQGSVTQGTSRAKYDVTAINQWADHTVNHGNLSWKKYQQYYLNRDYNKKKKR